MIGRLFCWLGLHKWVYEGDNLIVMCKSKWRGKRACYRCDRVEDPYNKLLNKEEEKMDLIIFRNSLRIIPRGVLEETFIEEVLGMRKGGDVAEVRRVDEAYNTLHISYIEICKKRSG